MLCARRPPIYHLYTYIASAKANGKPAIKAFQNLQLTEHHLDSLQQSAAGAGGNECGCGRRKRCSAAQLARSRGPALLRHRPPYIPGPYHRTDRLLVSIRVSQLPEARFRCTPVYVQCPLLRRSSGYSCRHGGVFSRFSSWSTTLLHECSKYECFAKLILSLLVCSKSIWWKCK